MNRSRSVTRYFPSGMIVRNDDLLSEGCRKTSKSTGSNRARVNAFTNQKRVAFDTTQQKVPFKEKPPKFETERQTPTRSDDIKLTKVKTPTETHSLRNSMHESASTEHNQKSPPKTICRSKSLKTDILKLNINKHSVYNVDINNIKIPSLKKQSINMENNLNHVNALTSSTNSNLSEDETCKTDSAMSSGLHANNTIQKHFKNRRDDCLQKCALLKRSKSAIQLKYKAKDSETIGLGATMNESNNEKVAKLKNITSRTIKKQQCNCESCDSFIDCITWCDNNITFEASTDSIVKNGFPLLKISLSSERPTNIKKICNSNILVHGAYIPQPTESLKDTCFNDNIRKAMSTMNHSSAKHLQSYMWPSIQRGLNVIMVGPAQSGKTFSYLPAICTFAIEKSEKYFKLSEFEGPQIIIMCPNNEKCKQLKKLIDSVIDESWEEITAEVLNDPAAKIHCNILVAVPSTLEVSLKSECVKLKRLCHLVMEDTDVLLKDYHQNIEKFLKVVDKLQANRPYSKSIQLIVSSERWTADIEHLMKKLYTSPTIVFEDFLEAAIYSNINFIKKKLNSAHRIFYLEDILKKQYFTHRSIVFCHEYEIAEVQEYLEVKGIECILISNDLSEDALFENEDMWCSLKMGRYKVLLCTDALFDKTIRILDANWLIHYSLPSSWSIFQKRFRCLSENFNCSLENPNDNHEDTYSFLLWVSDEMTEEIFTNFLSISTRSHVKHLKLT